MVLDIINARREEGIIRVIFNSLDIQDKDLSKAMRKLKRLHTLARDSEELPLDDPIMIIGNTSFPMRKHDFLPEWSITVRQASELCILYNGRYHELGCL